MNGGGGFLDRLDAVLRGAMSAPEHERASVLRALCAGDEDLLREAESMLDAARRMDAGFLGRSLASGLRGDAPGRAGPWAIGEPIGVGGMGAVYLGRRADGAFEADVAVKFVSTPTPDPDRARRVERFLRERQILAKLDHPCIARLLDAGVTDEGRPYLVMEYVRGLSLIEYCDARRATIRERLALFARVCDAVQHAHASLVVHRDLKPSNILVDESGRPRLLDFGIAGLLDDGGRGPITRTTERRFTPQYAAPEQVRGEPVTIATDVYALGVILYELLTGARPYAVDGAFTPEDARTICDTDPPRPSRRPDAPGDDPASGIVRAAAARRSDPASLRRALRGDLDHIVMTALRKEPPRRYPTAMALRDDIDRYRRGLPVSARPDSRVYRARKFIARNRFPVAAAGFAAGAMVLATAISSAMFLRAREAGARAEHQAGTALTINSYLSDLLSSIEPEVARGRDVSVFHEALDRTSRRILAELDDAPVVASELHHTVGRAYHSIGEYGRAAVHLEHAVRLGRESRRPPDERIRSLVALGHCRTDENAFDQAESAYRRAMLLAEQTPGGSGGVRGEILTRIGHLETERGRYDRAEATLRRALGLLRASGDEGPALAEALELLAKVLIDRRRTDEAGPMLAEAAGILRDSFGDPHPRIATLDTQLAWLARRSGDPETALLHAERALSARRVMLDPGHPLLANSLIGTAAVLEDLGRFDRAEEKYADAIEILVATVGTRHNETGTAYNNLGGLYRKMGRHDDALRMLETAAEIYTEVRGDDDYWVSFPRSAAARCLLELERYDEALGAADECLRIRRLHAEEDSVHVAESRGLRGAALAGLGRFEEAEAELTASHRVLSRPPRGEPGVLRWITGRLVELYERWGRPARADRWRGALDDHAGPGGA